MPQPTLLETYRDFFGNRVHCLEMRKNHHTFSVVMRSEVETYSPATQPNLEDSPPWETATTWKPDYPDALFRLDSPLAPHNAELRTLAEPFFPPGRPLLAAVSALTSHIYHTFAYQPGATSVFTPLREVLRLKRGVCQDFAHVQIAALRAMGLAARYVSGYLETLPPPGTPKLVGADASHAWISVLDPRHGWVDFDPTNDMIPGERHVTIAWGRDYSDLPPIKGVIIGGAPHDLSVAVDVMALPPDPDPSLTVPSAF
jgi:transglutaminase-like putative cysteine protease